MRVVSHHCQHICCGAAREAFMGFLGGSLVCHDGVGSGIAGMDRLENVTKTTFTARTRFRRPLYHSRQPFDGESGMAVAYGLWWSSWSSRTEALYTATLCSTRALTPLTTFV